MTIYTKLALLGLTVVALASVGTPSAANPTDQLQLSSGSASVIITDNEIGVDINPLVGTIAYANSNFKAGTSPLRAGLASRRTLAHLVSD
jgi:hypothetical protein